MSLSIESKIKMYEDRLQRAMRQSDVNELDKLLSQKLVFTNHLGQLMTKQDDLEAHQSGMLKINDITLSDQHINIYNDVAIVTVQAQISGRYADVTSDVLLRFTRIWNRIDNDHWQLIAGHSSAIV